MRHSKNFESLAGLRQRSNEAYVMLKIEDFLCEYFRRPLAYRYTNGGIELPEIFNNSR